MKEKLSLPERVKQKIQGKDFTINQGVLNRVFKKILKLNLISQKF
jgi:hypothetical protein